ncbi:MAG: GNAT family N-acetyltransferase [Saprospiraceae bacterium]
MNQSILDHLVWNAILENPHLALQTENAGVFELKISPLAAVAKYEQNCFDELHSITEPERVLITFSKHVLDNYAGWQIIESNRMQQMVYQGQSPLISKKTQEIKPVTDVHIPEMLELTALTKPGPFLERTVDFGQYHGIFENRKLVAMAGLRLQAGKYKEISAVCTHPDSLGKGYAGALLEFIIDLILSLECIPFLHVRKDNSRAIAVYERMGFEFRSDFYYTILQRV